MDQDVLLLFLKRRHTGRQNAVTSSVLEALLRVSGRKLRAAVNELRCGGHPVCSDENGYYYAATEAEVTATIRQLQSRIGKIAGAKNGLVRAAERYSDSGQTSLPL